MIRATDVVDVSEISVFDGDTDSIKAKRITIFHILATQTDISWSERLATFTYKRIYHVDPGLFVAGYIKNAYAVSTRILIGKKSEI
jgi:hypothetical protein